MSKIISLADAYAAEQQDWGSGSERTRIARAALAAEVEKLEAELEAARKDAARYRFIETHPDYGACIWSDGEDGTFGWFHVTAAQIDAAIGATK